MTGSSRGNFTNASKAGKTDSWRTNQTFTASSAATNVEVDSESDSGYYKLGFEP